MNGLNKKQFKLGQLLVACVTAEKGDEAGLYDLKRGTGMKRKLQLSIEPKLINKSLSISQVTAGMVLQA